MRHRHPIAETEWRLHASEGVVTCVFSNCNLQADYELIARWPAGHVWQSETCLVHMEGAISALRDIRPAMGDPTLAWVPLRA